jgi:ATP-dependent Clp protease adapter protein ClpS
MMNRKKASSSNNKFKNNNKKLNKTKIEPPKSSELLLVNENESQINDDINKNNVKKVVVSVKNIIENTDQITVRKIDLYYKITYS